MRKKLFVENFEYRLDKFSGLTILIPGFFYIRDEQAERIKASKDEVIPEFNTVDKKKVEEDVRSILKVEDDEKPVILDLESVKVLSPGKFELDIVSLMNRKPVVFKVSEGKYVIDIDGM